MIFSRLFKNSVSGVALISRSMVFLFVWSNTADANGVLETVVDKVVDKYVSVYAFCSFIPEIKSSTALV